ncbi:hypothetical protein DIY07_09535 [Streptococcus iniae]|uniref:Uncharacterized protein n=1 Tax=Streptococcus iniae TaxID=1346 RepID=A0A3L8GAP8_STRIN|nr:hypothetical protein [Streptococcus iniae]RLU51743.1 hypothetical protein DIY09_09430 [Streptococcus iniae]RLU54866.1 hypothetical protein DIY07_09535 [Streptococcus iniae]
MITPRELTHRIEHTTLPEAVELFKEKVLNDQLTHYPNLVFRQEIKEAYEQINYDGAFFFFVESDLGFSRGGLSDCIETEQEKVALLLLLVEAYERYVDVNTGIEDWLGYDCIFCDFVVSNEAAAKPLTQTEYEAIRDLIVTVIDYYIPSMTVMETWEYEAFKQGQNPNDTKIDNVQITLPLFDKQEK